MAAKEEAIRTVLVRRWLAVVLLLVVTAGIVGLTISLQGKAYSTVDPVPFRDVKLLIERLSAGPTPMPVVVALTAPIILNILMFMPWGFLMFIVLDRPERATYVTYLLTFLLGLGLSLGIEAWQYFLPTRVTDVNDVIWNATGAILGAFFGHLRKRVRIAFE